MQKAGGFRTIELFD